MPRRALFIVALVACRIAIAAEDEPVKAPHIEPGDCWTYRAESLVNREEIRSFEECVTFVDRAKDVILATARINGGDREIDTSYTGDWGTVVSIDGLVVPGALKLLRFPMRPGDSYSIDIEFSLALLGDMAGRAKYDVRVLGWEDVTVPAGTFRALRVEARGTIRRYDLGSFGNLRNVLWYSPKVHRWVKTEFTSTARSNRRELVGYRLNQ